MATLEERPILTEATAVVPENPDGKDEPRARKVSRHKTFRSWKATPAVTLLIGLSSVATFLGVWAMVTELGWVKPVFLPSPMSVLDQGIRLVETGDLWVSVIASSTRVFTGFGLAVLFAVPLGILIGVWWPAKAIMDPFISLLRPLPSITWIPLSILWLGIGEAQKIAIVFMGSWVYILLYTYESTKRVDPILIRAARNLSANDFAVMREVVLPGALSGIISGLKVTLAISWSCVITAEMVAANNGLGALIWQAKDWGNMPLVLMGMVCISLTVLVADWIMVRIERLLLPWERNLRE
ncbi:ABC transporter permease [Roseovarius amoyensis]|uniref:ABC transporter permease n=1 Tax=Roseovarius amoyensis TaxID=2211448 RepID=UPI000DBE7BFD|nr:ABC transporter permease [Roseovarius amoyensis]